MADLEAKILDSRTSASKVLEVVPTNGGVYAIFLTEGVVLPHKIPFGKSQCIYVGKAESGLRKRFSQEHLKTGNSGRSAFRRRLGAVLKEQMHLKSLPRDDKFGIKHRLFKFNEEGEMVLTDWIYKNTFFGWYELVGVRADFENAEKFLADILHPPLPDRPDWGNPFKETIDRLIKICEAEAAAMGIS